MPCSSWTNKIITAKDHASVQINIGQLDEEGVYNSTFATFALNGQVRARVRCLTSSGCATQGGARPPCWSRAHSDAAAAVPSTYVRIAIGICFRIA